MVYRSAEVKSEIFVSFLINSVYCTGRLRADELVRDRLCSASVISWLASSQDKVTEICPIKLSPVIKGLQSLGRGRVYDPKLRRQDWPSSKSSSLYILF